MVRGIDNNDMEAVSSSQAPKTQTLLSRTTNRKWRISNGAIPMTLSDL